MPSGRPTITYLNDADAPERPAANSAIRRFGRRGGAIIFMLLVASFLMGGAGALGTLTLLSDNQALLKRLGLGPIALTTIETKKFVLEESSAVSDASDTVSPSVVSITTTKNLTDFFGRSIQQEGAGTGFIVTNDGYIVTNKHVASSTGDTYTIFLNDGRNFDGKVIATDPANDLAIIKIDATGLRAVDLGDSDQLKVGQAVIAIGNALGEFQNTVTVGVLSAKERQINASGGGLQESLENLLQTDAAINPGNSGGPLVNLAGQVVGINTAIAGGAQNIGFAIPINSVKQAIESAEKTGSIKRPSLGVRFVPITKELADVNDLPVDHGALIVRGQNPGALAVIPGSPADRAGIEENDILLEVNGERIDERHSLIGLIQRHAIGDSVTLKVLHDGKERTVEVTLDELKR
jgi:serine protease Do